MFHTVSVNDITISSKTLGRRNWVIKTHNKTAVLYSFGYAKRRGLLGDTLKDIFLYDINWLEYTYKADAFKALETLKENG